MHRTRVHADGDGCLPRTDCGDTFKRVRLPLSDIPDHDPAMVPLLHYWQMRRRNQALPAKREIDPTQLKQFLGRLHIVDTHADDPECYFFALWGSNCYLDGGTDAHESGVPAYHLVHAINHHGPYECSRLTLPLGERGTHVTHLLLYVRKRPITEFKRH